jgi:hypothetical protein
MLRLEEEWGLREGGDVVKWMLHTSTYVCNEIYISLRGCFYVGVPSFSRCVISIVRMEKFHDDGDRCLCSLSTLSIISPLRLPSADRQLKYTLSSPGP